MSEASTGLLSTIFTEPQRVMALALARGVTEAWFDGAQEATIWAAMVRMHKEHRGIDVTLLVQELDRQPGELERAGGREKVFAVNETSVTASYAQYYLDIFANEMLARGVNKVFNDARDSIQADPAEAIGTISRQLRNLLERGVGQLETAKAPLLQAKLEQWREVARQRFELHNKAFCMGVPLPWGCLNSIFSGLRPGLHIMGARTSVGKTAVAMNISEFWCQRNIPHAFISLDMEQGELLSRYVSSDARVSLRKLEWGARHDELEAAAAAIPRIDQSCMHMTTLRQVERQEGWLYMAQQRWGIRAVIIDYIQLVRLKNDRGMRGFERVCEAVQYLKDLANNMGLPFLILAQLSREIDKAERDNIYAEPRLSDLGDSSELEKAAASVILMHRDQIVENYWRHNLPVHLAYGDEHLAKLLRALWLKVEKNQQGLSGVRRPFVMYPNQFMVRPGCYECREAIIEEMQNPYSGKTTKVNSWRGAFAQIRDDWRELPEDQELQRLGGLGAREYQEGQ